MRACRKYFNILLRIIANLTNSFNLQNFSPFASFSSRKNGGFMRFSKKFHVVSPGSDWFLHIAASSSTCLVLLGYSMLAFIANSFRLFRVIPLGLGESVQYFMNNFFNTDVLYVYNLPYVHHIHSVKKNPLNAKS